MKKRLNDIFNEAEDGELEALLERNPAADLSEKTLSAIKRKVYEKSGMEPVPGKHITRKRRSVSSTILRRALVVAACISLAFITVFNVLPRLNSTTPPIGGDETPSESTGGDNIDRNPGGLPEELIAQLMDAVTSDDGTSDRGPSPTFSMSLDLIKNGYHPILVEFDDSASQMYSVCAYFTSDDGHYELYHCCRDKFTWVKFDDPNEIPEYYNGQKHMRSFLIDVTSSCRDLMDAENEGLSFNYCRRYWPEFIYIGVNFPREPVPLTGTRIILCDPSSKNLYYNYSDSDWAMSEMRRLNHYELDGEYYILMRKVYVHDGELHEKLKYQLGDYYEYLIDRMRCSVTNEYIDRNTGKKTTVYQCSFKLDDIIKATGN